MRKGDHIYVIRSSYAHHGIYVGGDRVIHWYKSNLTDPDEEAVIAQTSLDTFADGGAVRVREYGKCLPVEETVQRAKSRLGEKGYHPVTNNCEHFATWCKTGRERSEQVRDAASAAGGAGATVAATAGSMAAVSAAGSVSGLSGAGIMSGLAAIGPGGAIGGVLSLGALPAVASVAAVHSSLRDDEHLPEEERAARKAGRTASIVATGGAAAGTVAAISGAGTTAGLSAAGITSGLSAIGSVVGGGMAAGTAVCIALPAVAAAVGGLGVYKIWKWLTD